MNASRPSLRLACTIALPLTVLSLLVIGCGKKPAGDNSAPSPTSMLGKTASQTDVTRFSNSGTELLKAATEPTKAFHLSYKAQAQINPKYPMDEKAKPEVGSVTMEADISPTEIKVISQRGAKKTDVTAKKEKELDWAMIKLALLGPITDVSMTMAFASPVAKSAGPDTVGGVAAEKFVFDTRTASATEKVGMDAASGMLRARVKHNAIYGTVSVDKATGMLLKFNMDVELGDKGGNTWKEHYEGEVTPKP